jgi:dephospho-CoA kinase
MHESAGMERFSVGLTGGIGSGKSTVAELFAQRGATIVDTDLIARQLTASNGLAIDAIKTAFGDELVLASGEMDRDKMRSLVFNSAEDRKKLEAILHPLIRQQTEQAAADATGAYVMFVVPLLVESGTWKTRVTRILAVDCPEEIQIQRVVKRNGFSDQQVRAIMQTQASRKERLTAADDVIVNDADTADLSSQVEKLHLQYLALSNTR